MSTGTESTTLDSSGDVGCLVRVKAQVMTRDDSTGMWVPMSGGGMSVVSLHRVLTPRAANSGDDVTYVILGQRIADRSMALNCELVCDFHYTSVNPTFHHWMTNGKRFGLTFQTSSDATAFQKCIQRIQQKMRREKTGSEPQLDVKTEDVDMEISAQNKTFRELPETEKNDSSMNTECVGCGQELAPKTAPRMPCITPRVFIKQPAASQTIPLRSRSSSDILSQVPPALDGNTETNPTDKKTDVTLGSYGFYVDVSANSVGFDGNHGTWLEGDAKEIGRKVGCLSIPSSEEDAIYFSGSYVHFAKSTAPDKHEYCYPSLDSFKFQPYGSIPRSPYSEPQQVLSSSVPVPIPIKSRRRWFRWKKKSSSLHRRSQNPVRKSRCVYCDEYFTPDENHPGSCKDAPDRILACIKAATCVCCQNAVLYHCKGGDEDSEVDAELDCAFGGRRRGCCQRVMLILVCLVVPCLWCYLPLKACHKLCVSSQCCGPRHKAAR